MGAMVLAIASCFLHQVAILSIRSLVTKHHTLLQPGAKGKRIATARKPDEADSARQNVLRRPPPRDHTGESPVPQTPAAQTPAAGATDSSRLCHKRVSSGRRICQIVIQFLATPARSGWGLQCRVRGRAARSAFPRPPGSCNPRPSVGWLRCQDRAHDRPPAWAP